LAQILGIVALNRSCLKRCTLLCAIGSFAFNGWAQTYPARSVRFVVPFQAGSGTDTIARLVSEGLAQAFGQQVIVENRPGAAGNIGAEVAAKSPADGYTLFMVSLTHAANVTVYPKRAYDLVRDFAPVTQLGTGPEMVVVHPSLPVKSVPDLVRLARAKPAAINFASGGVGTAAFLGMELFKRQAEVNIVHVPYRGGGAAMTALVAGEVSVYFAPVATALPFVRQRRLRGLAVTSAKRMPLLPEYPTVAETGFPGYESGNWYGVLVPVKTPKEIIATIRDAALTALNHRDISRRLAELGYVSAGSQPEEFAVYIKAEIERLGKVLQTLSLNAD
jgi:tripartite-type tricarboxylate transporter receptor subunit TctC